MYMVFVCVFFFNQKTAYEMRISDWSSDVCSSDLIEAAGIGHVVVNVHYLADALEAHLAAQKRPFTIAVSDEREQLLETGGGMVKALPQLSGDPILIVNRSEERRVGKECVSTCRSRWSP